MGLVLGSISLLWLWQFQGNVFVGLDFALPQDPTDLSHPALADRLNQTHIRHHLEALAGIAEQHGSSRSVAHGYRESGDYVYNVLHSTGACDTLEMQWFKAPIWHERRVPRLMLMSPAWIPYRHGIDFQSLRYGGSGTGYLANAKIVAIPYGGCSSSSHTAKSKGAVVVIGETRQCSLWEAALVAQEAGAVAILFQGSSSRKTLLSSRVRRDEWQEGDPLLSIPAMAISFSVGRSLTSFRNARVSLFTATTLSIVPTFNILCEWRATNADDTVVVGAHLDSVAAGPGINDNGSGSATTLEILLAMRHQQAQPSNRLVFAWWGAEEDGLLGSRHFVRSLFNATRSTNFPALQMPLTWDQVSFYLNFDMLASPNYIPMVHRSSDAPTKVAVGSYFIELAFTEFFERRGYPYQLAAMKRGSDFVPFMTHGVPSGGLLTGARQLKTDAERARFGGLANTALDPCYHAKCDGLVNINWEALYRMSEAAAYAVHLFAYESDLQALAMRRWVSPGMRPASRPAETPTELN
ncbi:hypothetical protein H4R34_003308 [Dimargaris verticillata]|uniref:Peptide hydrolase n=1 Tax=Dimargaris verticillata TaxID=2761393 RepID=A0A9W8B4U0_9FUNG|nr:hypothetical protein H4R34_003308 [Dimargaris verticillata]